MRGRCWIYVCDRWKDRIGLGGRMEGRAQVVFPTFPHFSRDLILVSSLPWPSICFV